VVVDFLNDEMVPEEDSKVDLSEEVVASPELEEEGAGSEG
jgi:hypothetical protein